MLSNFVPIKFKMKSSAIFILFLVFNFSFVKSQNIINPEKIENAVQKHHLNTIIFMDKAVSEENLKESDFLSTMIFQEDKDLAIRIFQDNSLINYLHQLDPSLTADELLKKGNY